MVLTFYSFTRNKLTAPVGEHRRAPFGKVRGPDLTATGTASFAIPYPTVKRRLSETTPIRNLCMNKIIGWNFKTSGLSDPNPPVQKHSIGKPRIMDS